LVVLVLVGRVRGVRRRGLLGRLRRLTGRRGVVVRRLRLVVLASTRGIDDDHAGGEDALIGSGALPRHDERFSAVGVTLERERLAAGVVEGALDDSEVIRGGAAAVRADEQVDLETGPGGVDVTGQSRGQLDLTALRGG